MTAVTIINATTYILLTLIAVAMVAGGCATHDERAEPPSASVATNQSFSVTTSGSPPLSYQWRQNGPPVDKKTPTHQTRDISWASPNGLGKTKEAELRRELATAVDHWREAYERRETAALEKLLADEFTVSFSGKTQTKSNALATLGLSQSEFVAVEDVKIRVDERSPVVTFRSVMRFNVGTETITSESLSSLQFRHCSFAEEQRGCDRWLVTSATHMPVHQMSPDYWTRENSWRPKP